MAVTYPLKDPIGVRAAPTITTSLSWFLITVVAKLRLNVFVILVAITKSLEFWLLVCFVFVIYFKY